MNLPLILVDPHRATVTTLFPDGPDALHDGWANRIIRLGVIKVWIDDAGQYVETRWPDGLRLGATPNPPATDWPHTLAHELAHTWLAQQAGLAWSPCLRKVAEQVAGCWDGLSPTDPEVAEEEARVLAWQRETAGRRWPWEAV